MLKIGDFNTLKVARLADFGAYLDCGNEVEVLIPTRYLTETPEVGQELTVFVYTDSEDRLIATTENPTIRVGEFNFLTVKEINPRIGAFLEWVPSKDILCPFSEQRVKMQSGHTYLVYAYLDDATKRVVVSEKVEKFLGNVYPDYEPHQRVKAMIYKQTEIGFKAIVDGLHAGMIYADEFTEEPEIGEILTAFVRKVRDDGKLDLTLKHTNRQRALSTADSIIELMRRSGGNLSLNDKSSPEEIRNLLGCSKKDFKKAIGTLYKNHKIRPQGDIWALVP